MFQEWNEKPLSGSEIVKYLRKATGAGLGTCQKISVHPQFAIDETDTMRVVIEKLFLMVAVLQLLLRGDIGQGSGCFLRNGYEIRDFSLEAGKLVVEVRERLDISVPKQPEIPF